MREIMCVCVCEKERLRRKLYGQDVEGRESKGFLIRFDAKKFNITSLAPYNKGVRIIVKCCWIFIYETDDSKYQFKLMHSFLRCLPNIITRFTII